MILIISNNDDWATNDVVEWLRTSYSTFKRLNFDDIGDYDVQLKMIDCSPEVRFHNKKDDTLSFSSTGIATIWFRRTTKLNAFSLDEAVNI